VSKLGDGGGGGGGTQSCQELTGAASSFLINVMLHFGVPRRMKEAKLVEILCSFVVALIMQHEFSLGFISRDLLRVYSPANKNK